MINNLIYKICNRIMDSRPPDVYIGGKEDPYLIRWWVIPRNRFFNIYLHWVKRSDDDRALHDHPWLNMSYIVDGAYNEVMQDGTRVRRDTGDVKFRFPTDQHRLEVIEGQECMTLFITGPVVRTWGFQCPKGWVKWTDFVAKKGKDNVNVMGCGEVDPILLHNEPSKSSFRRILESFRQAY